jgi:hypothetical protein
MKRLATFAVFAAFTLAGSALAEEKPSDTAALTASMAVLPCTGQGDATNLHQCELRDTARSFLIAGQREAALRILCETTPAIEVFRPQGALTGGKYEDNIAANRRCLDAMGIKSNQ